MALPASRLTLRRAWAPVTLRSTITDIPAERIRRWLEDLPAPIGYSVVVKPLRYRHRPHLFAYTLFDERYIQLQVPEPFREWMENVYHRARRIPGRRLKFRKGCGPDGMPSKLNAFLPQRSSIIPGAANAGKASIAAVKTLQNRAWRFI